MKRQITVVLLASVVLGGCSFGWWNSYNGVTNAVPPRASGPAPMPSSMRCLASGNPESPAQCPGIAVAIHADGTGKYNHIAERLDRQLSAARARPRCFASQSHPVRGRPSLQLLRVEYRAGDARLCGRRSIKRILAEKQDAKSCRITFCRPRSRRSISSAAPGSILRFNGVGPNRHRSKRRRQSRRLPKSTSPVIARSCG